MNKQDVASAIEFKRLTQMKIISLPNNCTKADASRLVEDAQGEFPLHGIIAIRFVSCEGSKKYPEGRELDEGESWVEN